MSSDVATDEDTFESDSVSEEEQQSGEDQSGEDQSGEEQWGEGDTSWSRCVRYLLPGARRLLEHGDIDPSKPVRVRDDFYVRRAEKDESRFKANRGYRREDLQEMMGHKQHPGRFSHAAPLCFLGHWAGLLKLLAPPPEHPFYRFWRPRRQQKLGQVPHAAAAAVAAANQDSEEEAVQPPQKKARLAQPAGASSTSEVTSCRDDDVENLPQPNEMVEELLRLLQKREYRVEGIAPLSPEEHKELAPLVPGGHALNALQLAAEIRWSKTELILDLVLEDRVRTLLELGANPTPRKPKRLQPGGNLGLCMPLRARSCPTSVVRLLVEAKADPNRSLLHGEESSLLSHDHNPEAVRLLLEAGGDPHHIRLRGPHPSLADPVEEPLFLRFVHNRAPAKSLRLLLKFNAEIIEQSQWRDLDFGGTQRTPLSVLMTSQDFHPYIRDIVLKIPYPFPAKCFDCEKHPDPGCWGRAAGQTCPSRTPAFLRTLVRTGYPTRGHLQQIIRHVIDSHRTYLPDEHFPERLKILQSVTEEGQAQYRQEYLGGFWSAIMQAVPSLSGVVASLVLQAIVPEFQLRIA